MVSMDKEEFDMWERSLKAVSDEKKDGFKVKSTVELVEDLHIANIKIKRYEEVLRDIKDTNISSYMNYDDCYSEMKRMAGDALKEEVNEPTEFIGTVIQGSSYAQLDGQLTGGQLKLIYERGPYNPPSLEEVETVGNTKVCVNCGSADITSCFTRCYCTKHDVFMDDMLTATCANFGKKS